MSLTDFITTVSSVATCVGVFLAWWQIQKSVQQGRTTFEDQLANEYRVLARQIPCKALFGETLTDAEYELAKPSLYSYIDLSNEQVFLFKAGRIRPQTWLNWRDGIQANLKLPAFARAWEEVQAKCAGFDTLRELVASGYTLA